MSDVNAADIDAPLVDQLRLGDGEALGALYQRYGSPVRSFLARVVPALADEDIDDLCQETFMTFADGVQRYQHIGKLRSWLFGIAVRKARSALRRQRWRRAVGMQTGAPAAGVALGQPRADDRVDARRRIGRALEDLPAPQRGSAGAHGDGGTLREGGRRRARYPGERRFGPTVPGPPGARRPRTGRVVIDDALQQWAASRRRQRPSSQEARALVGRWQRRRSRTAWLRTGLGFALAAAVALVVVAVGRHARLPGEVPVVVVEEPPPQILAPGLHHEDGDSIEVADDSAVTVVASGALVLTEGTVHVEARPRPATSPLTITAGTATVTVVGTRFSVTLTPLRVAVFEGVVRVTQRGEEHIVRAGETYPQERRPFRSLDDLRTLSVEGDMDEARTALRDHLDRRPSDADVWSLLARVESRAGRSRQAIRAWQEVVERGRTGQARQARFELARLYDDRPRKAIRWLEAYLADPGPWAPEARLRLGQAQSAIGDPASDDTLRRVVSDHPGTTAAATARALLGEKR